MFENNGAVSFADVNLSEEPIRGNHNPGAGGWPTIKYFNKDTGYDGAPYTKKTDKAMCDELGNEEYMQQYIEEAGKTSLCSVETGDGCGERELKFISKWSQKAEKVVGEISRLQGLMAKPMKDDLKAWVKSRIGILNQFADGATPEAKDEL
jgi:hypothetical protein